MVGISGQYRLAARVVLAKLPTLEWVRLADPEAGVADDFQFKCGPRRHALQVKWSQLPGSFTWADFTSGEGESPGLLTKLAAAWRRMRAAASDPLTVYLCTNNHASRAAARGTSPIGQATAVGTRSLASFLARSFEPVRLAISHGCKSWEGIADLPEVAQWAPVWAKLLELTGLDGDEFVHFVGDLELRFGMQLGDSLVRRADDPTERDATHLAQTIQDIVIDPSWPVELSREQLMDRLGWLGHLRYRHPHQFPIPAAYATNEAAQAEVEARLARLSGGYIALVGPAGSGKSTLLASLNLPGHVARYYAFVPDAPDPLSSRGEAGSFLHDVSLALEESGLYRRGIGNDLVSQRNVLLDQIEQAGRRSTERGEPTVIVIDGLDHIPREQRPQRSLLEELPSPAALPEGVYILLGTQTVSVVPLPVRTALEHDDRIAALPPLADEEVEQIAAAAGLGAWLHLRQLATLVDASEGHPLALKYALEELSALEESEPDPDTRRGLADALLVDATRYGGNIASRYRGYFQAASGDQAVLNLLGMVARLRVPLNIGWLSTWAEPEVVSGFIEQTATFFHRVEADWQFIHNSFRRFLADETARLGEYLDEARDQRFHHELAEVCASSGNDWSLYRDEEVAHRFLAHEHSRVLDIATPDSLRRSLLDLRPSATVRDHAVLALRSATLADDPMAFLRMLVFLNELWLRGTVLDPEPLVKAVHEFDSQLALEHIVRGGRLRINAGAALDHAVTFAIKGDAKAAQQIVRACGGLAGLTADDRASPTEVATWAEVTWRLSGLNAVLAELDHHLPLLAAEPTSEEDTATLDDEPDTLLPNGIRRSPQRTRQIRELRERESNRIYCRNLAHARCFDLLVDARDDDVLDALTLVIDAEASPGWRARARLVRARAASDDGVRMEVLRRIREMIAIEEATGDVLETDEDDEEVVVGGATRPVPLTLRVSAAEELVRNGFNEAIEIDQLVPQGTAAAWPSTFSGQEGIDPYRTLIAISRLREVRPDTTQPDLLQGRVESPRDAGNERFRRALRALAQLEGQQLAASAGLGEPAIVAAHADPIIRLLEVPVDQTRDWTGWYIVRDVATHLFRRIVELAARSGGYAGLVRLLAQFDAAWATPERAKYWTPALQQEVVVAAANAHPHAVNWAIEQLERLDTLIDLRTYDPHDRVARWLTQARAWAAVDKPINARHAAQSAVRASLGVGASDHDRQLDEWLDWLRAAVDAGEMNPAEFDATVRAYASRIASANDEASNQAESAAEKLIALTFPRDAALACDLADWLCDSGTLSEADSVQSVILGACRHAAISVTDGVAAAVHMMYPIKRAPSQDIPLAVAARCGEDSDEAAALRQADAIWVPRETRTDPATGSPESQAADGSLPEPPAESPPVENVGSLLRAMRNAVTAANSPPGGWEHAVERVVAETTTQTMAQALIEQAGRLRLGGAALGGLAALAARSGAADAATRVLADTLGRTQAYGWLQRYDGGTRLTIFDAALRDRHPALIELARNDLASSFATGSLSGQLSPDGIRRIVDLVAGPEVVACAWPHIETYLDEVAPAGANHSIPSTSSRLPIEPIAALSRWVSRYLGHPVRPLDFGARRTLQLIGRGNEQIVQRVLAEAIAQGGWTCEAALMTLITTPDGERCEALSPVLVDALRAASVRNDGICRDLASRVSRLYRVALGDSPPRPLPAAYNLALPPLPERTLPELDRHGTPHLDRHNPHHLLAPFDLRLMLLAELAGLDSANVLHRAAGLAEANQERWIRGGHYSLADHLEARKQFHTYRPWAYMAGRRAVGTVLAELVDAGAMNAFATLPAYGADLIGERISMIVPQPVPPWMPPPWRPPGTPRHSVNEWSNEAPEAALSYKEAYSTAAPFVLAELAEWRSLEWGTPEEERRICATHSQAEGKALLSPIELAWEVAWFGAHRYPRRLHVDWSHEELVVHGHEDGTDTLHVHWLALHPAVGARLGWHQDPQNLFTWNGPDDRWRARTVLFARGRLSHRPPANLACAEVWQVLLSDAGYIELISKFPTLSRSLQVTRTLPASTRNDRPEADIKVVRTALP